MVFRLATPADASGLKHLNDLFNGDGCNSAEAIEQSLASNTQEIVCVADMGEELAGFCCGQLIKTMCYDSDYVELTEFFVAEEHRRFGIGRGLMEFAETEFRKRGIEDINLLTGKDNHTAQRFYLSCGYHEVREMMFKKRL